MSSLSAFVSARADFVAVRGYEPTYAVMDPETCLEILGEQALLDPEHVSFSDQAPATNALLAECRRENFSMNTIVGWLAAHVVDRMLGELKVHAVVVVVIPTDGIRILRMVAPPLKEVGAR